MNGAGPGKPLVSVLITSYNYLQFITQAIDSARAQTYADVEIVVLDNCSTDGTVPALRERYRDDPRVCIYENETNIGELRNSARVFEMSHGDYVMWLSADDWLYPHHVERLLTVFERAPAIDVVYSGAYFADGRGFVYTQRMAGVAFPYDYVDARDELVEMFTSTCPLCWPTALFRREVFLEVGLDDPDGPHAADWEMQIRIAMAGKRFAYLTEPSTAIRIHDAQATGSTYHFDGRRVLDYLEILEKYVDHPGMVRLRGREAAVAGFLGWLVEDTLANGGPDALTTDQRTRAEVMVKRFDDRAQVYEPARVRERTISIIMPVSRSPRLTERALASVARQTFSNWEIVMVDHGEISQRHWLDADPVRDRISYVRSPIPLLPGAARNVALRMARGEYLAFLGEDNTYLPDHLESLVATIERSGAVVAAASSRLMLEHADARLLHVRELGEAAIYRGPADDAMLNLVADALPLDALLLYRNIRDRAGGFGDTLALLDDYEFILRVDRAERIVFSPAVTVDIRARVDFSSLLGANLTGYLSVLNAIWAVHPVPEALQPVRDAQRAAVERAIHAVTHGNVTTQSAAELLATLAGHAIRPLLAAAG